VGRLAPRPGEVVLDIGCGTGKNFEQILKRLGPSGRLIGIEPSPAMLAHAERLVQRRGWTNVELVCAGAEDAAIPAMADAALLCGVHDVMRSPAALANILRNVREDGRIVAGGGEVGALAAVGRGLAQPLDLEAQPRVRQHLRGLPGALEPAR